jgi:hypothetical protein
MGETVTEKAPISETWAVSVDTDTYSSCQLLRSLLAEHGTHGGAV